MTFFGYPIWVVLVVCFGVFCASFMDAIGGGGGIISVPVYLLAGLPTHFALGTNKLSSGIGTAASTFRYLKNGFVDWALAIPSVVFALVGSHLGTKLQIAIDERYLKYMLLVVLPLVAVVMLAMMICSCRSVEYVPVVEHALLPAKNVKPPLLREHRLYQADWLLRFYDFKANELLSADRPDFNIFLDPKCDWAIPSVLVLNKG